MKLDTQIYKDVFSSFPCFERGLRVGDVIQPQRLEALFQLMPNEARQVLETMENDGFLSKNNSNPKSRLGSTQDAWHLTNSGFDFYCRLFG